MQTATVTGILYSPDGSPAASQSVLIRPLTKIVSSIDGGGRVPFEIAAATDATGAIGMNDGSGFVAGVDLSLGQYTITVQGGVGYANYSGTVTIDANMIAAGAADLEVTLEPAPPPQVVSDAQEARDEAVALQSAVQLRNLSADHTLALEDAGHLLVFSAAATLTIPPQSAVAWPAGTVIAAAQTSAAILTIAGGAGVMVVSAGTTALDQGQAATLIRVAEDEWLVLGDFV